MSATTLLAQVHQDLERIEALMRSRPQEAAPPKAVTRPPRPPGPVQTRAKKEAALEAAMADIRMIGNIAKEMARPPSLSVLERRGPTSLNNARRREEMRRIDSENNKLLKRLITAKSSYPVQEQQKSYVESRRHVNIACGLPSRLPPVGGRHGGSPLGSHRETPRSLSPSQHQIEDSLAAVRRALSMDVPTVGQSPSLPHLQGARPRVATSLPPRAPSSQSSAGRVRLPELPRSRGPSPAPVVDARPRRLAPPVISTAVGGGARPGEGRSVSSSPGRARNPGPARLPERSQSAVPSPKSQAQGHITLITPAAGNEEKKAQASGARASHAAAPSASRPARRPSVGAPSQAKAAPHEVTPPRASQAKPAPASRASASPPGSTAWAPSAAPPAVMRGELASSAAEVRKELQAEVQAQKAAETGKQREITQPVAPGAGSVVPALNLQPQSQDLDRMSRSDIVSRATGTLSSPLVTTESQVPLDLSQSLAEDAVPSSVESEAGEQAAGPAKDSKEDVDPVEEVADTVVEELFTKSGKSAAAASEEDHEYDDDDEFYEEDFESPLEATKESFQEEEDVEEEEEEPEEVVQKVSLAPGKKKDEEEEEIEESEEENSDVVQEMHGTPVRTAPHSEGVKASRQDDTQSVTPGSLPTREPLSPRGTDNDDGLEVATEPDEYTMPSSGSASNLPFDDEEEVPSVHDSGSDSDL